MGVEVAGWRWECRWDVSGGSRNPDSNGGGGVRGKFEDCVQSIVVTLLLLPCANVRFHEGMPVVATSHTWI